jgi:MFS family permease
VDGSGALGTQRVALGNRDLVRHVTAQLLGITAEVTVFIGVLVDAFDRAGQRAMGIASVTMLTPYLLVGPFAGTLATRYPPQRVRVVGFAVQTLAYGGAAIAALAGLPVPAVVGMAAIGAGAATTMRPTAAVVLPAIVRSSRELTVGNVWEGHTETVSQLVGAIAGALLLGAFGPAAVIGASGALTLVAAAVLVIPRPIDPPPSAPDAAEAVKTVALALDTVRELRTRTGALTVLVIAGAQFVLLGALDIIIVVLAEDALGLPDSGTGWLYTAVGIGAVVSGFVATGLSRRTRQAPAIAAALAAGALVSILLGLVLTTLAAVVLLALLGLAGSLVDVLTRLLLHRSIRPERLGSVFALLEFASGFGLVVGSLVAQLAVAVGGPRLALATVGSVLLVMLLLSWRGLRSADRAADVPVTAMSLFQRVALFAPLPRVALEDVARSAIERAVPAGARVVTQGEPGDEYYVVADGTFDVTIDGRSVGTVQRGGGFGEIALLADVPRTASVTARRDSTVLTVPRGPFLLAVTGHDSSTQAAWGVMRSLGHDVRDQRPADP